MTFVVVAARTFYGADTKGQPGGLTNSEPTPAPFARSDPAEITPAERGTTALQSVPVPSTHLDGVKSNLVSQPVSFVRPDSYYGRNHPPQSSHGNRVRPSIPNNGTPLITAPVQSERPSAAASQLGRNSSQGTQTAGSIYPEHIRQRLLAGEKIRLDEEAASAQSDNQKYVIPYDQRRDNQPSWSILPTAPAQGRTPSSQQHQARQPQQPIQQSPSTRPDTSAPNATATKADLFPQAPSITRPSTIPGVNGGSSPAIRNQLPAQNQNAPGTTYAELTGAGSIYPDSIRQRLEAGEKVRLDSEAAQAERTSSDVVIPLDQRSANFPAWSIPPQNTVPETTAAGSRQSNGDSKATNNFNGLDASPTPSSSNSFQNPNGLDPVRAKPLISPDFAPAEVNRVKSISRSRDLLHIPAPGEPAPMNQPGFPSVMPGPADRASGWSDFRDPYQDIATRWWEERLSQPLFPERPVMPMSLASCLSLAQSQSPELRVLHSEWFIQQAEADRLAAAFDWNTFVEAIWNRDSTPVGSDLDGATDRLRSRTGSSSFGLRRITESGAQLELSQQFGTRSGNSIFLNPNPQANSRLGFEYEKPLLRGFGRDYNTSPQRLAVIDKDTAYDRFRIGVQDYLLNVASGYWTLVLQRGVYLQAQASLRRVRNIADEMQTRTEVDVTPGMLDRARSEVSIRQASVVEARHDVIRTQAALLRLIYGANFERYARSEVVTQTLPRVSTQVIQPERKIQTALQQRSEVHQSIREIKAATIRYEVAANEVMPALNLVLTGYVAGLQPQNRIDDAWTQQFEEGEPGVGIGFDFEVPYRNRAAHAAAERQQITIKRMQAALQTTIADVAEDVQIQVIERNKFAAMLKDQRDAILRARSMLRNANIRREMLADGTRVADLYLEDLLQIQNRLEAAETAYLQSQIRYALADNALLRATSEIDRLAGSDSNAPVPDPISSGSAPMVSQPAHSAPTTGHSFGR